MIWDARLFAFREPISSSGGKDLWSLMGGEPGVVVTIASALLVIHVAMYWIFRFQSERKNGGTKYSREDGNPIRIQCPLETQAVIAKLSDQVSSQAATQKDIAKALDGQNLIMDRLSSNQKLVIALLGELRAGQTRMMDNQLDILLTAEGFPRRRRPGGGTRSMGGGEREGESGADL